MQPSTPPFAPPGEYDDAPLPPGGMGRIARTPPLLIVAAVGAIIGMGAVAAAHAVLPFGSPEQTFRTLTAALAAGDLETLATAEPLEASEAIHDRIMSRGTAEYERIVAIYEKRLSEGRAEHARRLQRLGQIRQRAESLGSERFEGLSDDERWRTWVGVTRRQWLFDQSIRQLDSDQQVLVPRLEVLDDPEARRQHLLAIGCEALGPDAVAIRNQVASGTLPASDPMVADVLNDCASRGARVISSAQSRLERYMDRADPGRRSRPGSRAAPQAHQNESNRKVELGFAALSAEDRAFWDANSSLENDESNATLERLGEPFLSESERAAIAPKTYEAFRASRFAFVRTQGAALVRQDLVRSWSGCDPRVVRTRYYADNGDVPLRSSFAALRWRSQGEVSLSGRAAPVRIGESDTVPAGHLHPGAELPAIPFRDAWRQGRISPDTVVGSDCGAELDRELVFYPLRGRWHVAWDGGPRSEPRPERSRRRQPW